MIKLDGLSARAGAFALDRVSFEVPARAYGMVIGPTGSGKTTLLETIAGLVPATAGRVMLCERDVTRDPADARGVGFVYQHGLLFPHLSVEQNVTYGTDDVVAARAVARRLGVDDLYPRAVGSLSGGERQLVALARALARRPAVLLLDEPFSALDPPRRTIARREVRAIHREWGLTTLHVTHDFGEAGSIGDVAILLDAGRVLQSGEPAEVFRYPQSPYVAQFLGAENVFAGTVGVENGDPTFRGGSLVLHVPGGSPGGPCHAVIRAGEILVARSTPAPSSARNTFSGRVVDVAPSGPLWRVTIETGGAQLVAAMTTHSADELALARGDAVYFTFKATAVHLC